MKTGHYLSKHEMMPRGSIWHTRWQRNSNIILLFSVSSSRQAPPAIFHITQLSSPICYGWNGGLGNDVIGAGIWARQLFPHWFEAPSGEHLQLKGPARGCREHRAVGRGRYFSSPPIYTGGNPGTDVQVKARILPQLRGTTI